jgi:hypothetical protein
MEGFLDAYSKIIGLLVLALVIIMLSSTPTMILTKSINTIGTELSHATEDETHVRTKMDFGSNEHISAFPQQVGNWTAYDYDTTQLAEMLDTDTMLMRTYKRPELDRPVFFLIMQSTNRSSFHPPIVCYPALGYPVEEEGKVQVPVQNASWAEGPWLSERDVTFNGTITAKKIVVGKETDEGTVAERRVVLYFYVKDRPFTSNTVTMVRVSAIAPTTGSYDQVLDITKTFMGDTIPYMFEIQGDSPPLFITLASSGSAIHKGVLGLLLLAPFTIIFHPQLRQRMRRRNRE